MNLKKIIFLLGLIPVFGCLCLGWAYFIEPNIIKIEKVPLTFDNLSVSLRIVHLSDFHTHRFGKREERVLKIVNKIDPDFIFITGDIVDWKTQDIDACYHFWQGLVENREGRVFGVLGNHEHRNPKVKEVYQLLLESGIEILDNDGLECEKQGVPFYLSGVDDPHLGFDDLDKALDGRPENRFNILLAHSPEIFVKAKGRDIDIVLAGHTHGCQINLPFLCDLIIPLKYDKQYKQGLFEEDGTYLYVNRGIGETFLPLRFNSFPEITLFELNS